MRVFRVVALLSLGALAACATAPVETVQLSALSPFDTPMDGRWRRISEKRPIAFLLGRVETTRVVGMRKAELRISCYQRPKVWVIYDVGLRTGPITVAYRFDAKAEQKGATSVRGRSRNIIKIDYAATAVAFQTELRTSSALKVRAQRAIYEMHDAHFRWDRNDKTLAEVFAACKATALEAARRNLPASDRDEEDEEIEAEARDVLPER